MSYLAVLGPEETNCSNYGALRSSIYDVVFEQGQAEALGSLPVVVKIDGKELEKGWAGRVPQTEDDRQKFQELVFFALLDLVNG